MIINPAGGGGLALVHLANDTIRTIVDKTNQYTENDALKNENSRHCSQLQDLQNDCLAYQSILQMLYTRLKDLLQLYNKTDVEALSMLACRVLPARTR